jgi:hypothetical protein
MKNILIVDLFDTLMEGLSHFTEVLSPRLSLATADVIAGLGGAPGVPPGSPSRVLPSLLLCGDASMGE